MTPNTLSLGMMAVWCHKVLQCVEYEGHQACGLQKNLHVGLPAEYGKDGLGQVKVLYGDSVVNNLARGGSCTAVPWEEGLPSSFNSPRLVLITAAGMSIVSSWNSHGVNPN